MVSVFAYREYREFLRDSFDELKRERRGFSHRAFARMAGFASSNFVHLVMQGKRNLSVSGIQKVARALKLKKSEAIFFENLVLFDQARTDAERNIYYERIAADHRYAKVHHLEKSQFEYYSRWYVPVIREMVLLNNFSEDPEWIARNIVPNITSREAGEAISLLLDLGLIERDGAGRLVQRTRHISSGDAVASLALSNYQCEMIERAAKSIDSSPADVREVGSVTFAVSKKRLVEAKRMIREFRSRLSSFLSEEEAAEAVYQFNVQLFNLSRVDEMAK
jgi:uncharacterized protein (TIGR02147 family)